MVGSCSGRTGTSVCRLPELYLLLGTVTELGHRKRDTVRPYARIGGWGSLSLDSMDCVETCRIHNQLESV